MGLISWIVLGAVAGWLTKIILLGRTPGGMIAAIPLGMVGALIGGFVVQLLGGSGVTGFNIWSIVVATLGGSIVVAIYQVGYRLVVGAGPRGAFIESERTNSAGPQPVRQQPDPTGHYDAVISYRRQHGAETARLIRKALKVDHKLQAFLDVDDLQAGHFDQAMLKRIANAPNFIVVLTPEALDRCVREGDWLRREIAQAIKTNSNIVPVVMPEFQFPEPQALPDEIRGLSTYQGVGYSHEFFDAMIDRLVRYLQ